jgi:UDP-3-O-[3-hydroxymyristoyl] N-acetylglucosamine deacetylase/3-hydroxyacyl-[acyl-carrier-protein] dehydratase
MSKSRRSISESATVKGIGLHSGKGTSVCFKPAPSRFGVKFKRVDLPDAPLVKATVDSVVETDRCTTIGAGDATVSTVEHLLAAVVALQIDDLLIEIDGSEPPAGDGSPEVFFDALRHAEPKDIDGDAAVLRLVAPLTVRDGDAAYIVTPSDSLRLTVTIEWDHPKIGRQSGCFDVTPEAFAESLSRARTFGFEDEVEELRAKGLAIGASEANAIVLSKAGLVGTELRWHDEFVRHKAVDLLGDLGLLGVRLQAEVVAFKPSHKGNVALARVLERTVTSDAPPVMGIQEIFGALPHRYPMLLVDRIVEIEPGKRIVGIKNVSINEPHFQGHFPGHPVMPGVLIVEAMAQAGGMMLMGAFENPGDKVVYFMSIDKVKFRRPVVPGDQIRFELEMLHFRGRNCRMSGVGYVDGKPVAEAEMMARVMDK